MEISYRFQIVLVLIYFQVYISSCDDLIPMLSDGEFSQAVGIIETKIGEMPSDNEASTVSEVAKEDGSINYYSAEDKTHPIFTRQAAQSGEKLIVLSRGEDHLMQEDRNGFVILQQKQGSEYAVHTAYIDDLETGAIMWDSVEVHMVDGAELILEMYGSHDHEEEGHHCGWFGMTQLLCCVMTMQERTDIAAKQMVAAGDGMGPGPMDSSDGTPSGSGYHHKERENRKPIGDGMAIPDGSQVGSQTPGSQGTPGTGAGSSMPGGGGNKGDKPGTSGDIGGIGGVEGESEEQTYITIKVGEKGKAIGRKLGSMLTRKGRTMPQQNKVSKRQSPADSRPRYHPLW